MELTGSIEEVRKQVKAWRKEGLSVGLVPTMGYLHEGHKSLIDRAVKENDKVVVSDFVNPIQFGVNEDLSTYPRDIEADKKLCESAGAVLIFHPGGDVCPGFFHFCGDGRGFCRAMRKDKAHPFPGGVYGGEQAVSYRYAG